MHKPAASFWKSAKIGQNQGIKSNEKLYDVKCAIRLYIKSQYPFNISFKSKLWSFISVPSLFKKEINAFDSLGIEWLVTILYVDVSYGNTLMILTERSFVLVLWILWKVVLFFNSLYNSCLPTA